MYTPSEYELIRKLSDTFAEMEGRRARILITSAAAGQCKKTDIRLLASNFADIGFDVDIGPISQTAIAIARQATENDVHVVGLFCINHENENLISQLAEALKNVKRPDIKILAGPLHEHNAHIYKLGASFILPPNGDLLPTAKEILTQLIDNR